MKKFNYEKKAKRLKDKYDIVFAIFRTDDGGTGLILHGKPFKIVLSIATAITTNDDLNEVFERGLNGDVNFDELRKLAMLELAGRKEIDDVLFMYGNNKFDKLKVEINGNKEVLIDMINASKNNTDSQTRDFLNILSEFLRNVKDDEIYKLLKKEIRKRIEKGKIIKK